MILEKSISIFAVACNSMMFYLATGAPLHLPHSAIDISLPVFVGAMLSTAVFVWALAKYDAGRTKLIMKTEIQMQLLLKQLEDRHSQIEASVKRTEDALEESRQILRSALSIMSRLGNQGDHGNVSD